MRIQRVLLVMALVGAAWAAVLVVALLAGVRLLPLAVAGPVAGVLVLPAFLLAVISQRKRSGQLRFRLGVDNVPRWLTVAAAGAFFLFWLAGITAFVGLGGNASIRDGQYVLDNHGTVTVVDKATYDRQLDHEERLVLAGFGAFGVGAAYLITTSK